MKCDVCKGSIKIVFPKNVIGDEGEITIKSVNKNKIVRKKIVCLDCLYNKPIGL